MLYFLIALVYWGILLSGVILSVVVPPIHRKFLSITEFATPLGRFLVVFFFGDWVYNVLEFLFISLFLCWVWKYVFPVVSYRSNLILAYHFSLFFFMYVSICFTVACTCGFLLNSRVYTQVYCEQSRMLLF